MLVEATLGHAFTIIEGTSRLARRTTRDDFSHCETMRAERSMLVFVPNRVDAILLALAHSAGILWMDKSEVSDGNGWNSRQRCRHNGK
jgi:hypothetical protein